MVSDKIKYTSNKRIVITNTEAIEKGYKFAWIEGPLLRETLFLISNLFFPIFSFYYLPIGFVFLFRKGGCLYRSIDIPITKSDKRYNKGYRVSGYRTKKEIIRTFSLNQKQKVFLRLKGLFFICFAFYSFAFYTKYISNEEVGREEIVSSIDEKRELIERTRLFRIDSLTDVADSLNNINHITKAIALLDSALKASKVKEFLKIIQTRAFYNYRRHHYQEAVNDYSTLISHNYLEKKNRFERAKSYIKHNEYQLAVNDLRRCIELGHNNAKELYERINPEKKRIVDYVIRCCDGSTSYSKSRRGTCSHHNGVCNWNEPVYETYRKY